MSFLLDKFCSFLPPNIASKYTASKLQQKLPNYFGSAIIVEKQCGQGKSNTIFSSSITVSEAIHAANNLKAELKFTVGDKFLKHSVEICQICMTQKVVLSLFTEI